VRRFGRNNSRWLAEIKYEGKVHYLGIHETAEEAAVTYDLAAMALHGEFAAPNFSYPERCQCLGNCAPCFCGSSANVSSGIALSISSASGCALSTARWTLCDAPVPVLGMI
jgi:hypothetical protein